MRVLTTIPCAGTIPEEVVEPMPRVLQALVRRLVRWGVLPAAKPPDSAIINIYEPEDCIPPHIDHHNYTRPLCTLRRAAARRRAPFSIRVAHPWSLRCNC